MVNRTTVSGSSTPPLSGPDLLNEYAERIDTLFDASALPLTAIGGTANAVTASLDPPLASAGVFVDGMKFTLTWGATNTGAVTLAINGGAALPVLDKAGNALGAGSVINGLRSLIEFVGGSFRILTEVAEGTAAQRFWAITASGTWNKPAGLEDDQMITVECWAGGGGGSLSGSGGGGGGGGYVQRRLRAADVPSSVSVTIGAGGAAGASGGNTSFGTILTAYAGRTTANAASSAGGGGGGELAQGANGITGGPSPGAGGGAGGAVGGGAGGGGNTTANGNGQPGEDARTIWGGAGGGGASGGGSGVGGSGGRAVFGGGGGGANTASGGQSLYGGNGGAGGAAGTAPGGGGGRGAAGARGEVRIWI